MLPLSCFLADCKFLVIHRKLLPTRLPVPPGPVAHTAQSVQNIPTKPWAHPAVQSSNKPGPSSDPTELGWRRNFGDLSSTVFGVMIVLARSSLPWVPHTWMSGANLQTPRAWFWGTHKWAILAALLGGIVSRIAGSVLEFRPLLCRGIELRSLRQSFRDGYSICSGLFWGERWWSVGVVATDGPILVWVVPSIHAVEDGFLCIMDCGDRKQPNSTLPSTIMSEIFPARQKKKIEKKKQLAPFDPPT